VASVWQASDVIGLAAAAVPLPCDILALHGSSMVSQVAQLPSASPSCLCREYVKPDGSVGYRSTRGWYRRDDKNGWRPVTERLLLDKEQQAALPAVSAAAAVSRTHGHKRRKPRVRLATDPWSRSCSNNEHQDGSTQQDGPEEQQQQETSTGHYGREAASSSGRSSPVFYHCCPAVRRCATAGWAGVCACGGGGDSARNSAMM
jgi:hypothetical protein